MIVTCIACSSAHDFPIFNLATPPGKDGILRDTPQYYSGFHRDLYEGLENDLGLSPLFYGVPHFEMRITGHDGLLKGWQIVIKEIDKNWTAHLYTFSYLTTTQETILDSVDGKLVFTGNPKSGWEQFLNNLDKHNILTLRDDTKIEGYPGATDELDVTVQIANKNNFKHYSYGNPEWKAKRHKEADDINKIVELLMQEFPINEHLKNIKSLIDTTAHNTGLPKAG